MAAIDKTYVNKEELLEAIEWAKGIGKVTLENGYKFSPLDWIKDYNDINNIKDKDEYVLWNTSIWFDRWLWCNCPLSFVRERLQEQYRETDLEEFENWIYEKPIPRKQKYTFLETPSGTYHKWLMGKGRRNNPWPNGCIQTTYEIIVKCPDEEFERGYNEEIGQWYPDFGFLPCYDDFIWQEYHKRIPSKKSIMRQLDKWTFPKGTIVTVHCLRYKGMDFKVLVK